MNTISLYYEDQKNKILKEFERFEGEISNDLTRNIEKDLVNELNLK